MAKMREIITAGKRAKATAETMAETMAEIGRNLKLKRLYRNDARRVPHLNSVSVTRRPNPWIHLARDERGSVEAGLTLIPLTILFLISAQLVFASQWGNAQHAAQQSDTNKVAIAGAPRSEAVNTLSDAYRYEPLLGGGHLVISERTHPIPFLASFSGIFPGDFTYRKRITAVSEVFTR